jgi:transcription elongation GreA/GreB family factor
MSVKKQLLQACIDHVQARIDTANAAIAQAREAANSETKSSAGDKYETGRAMMQQEIEKNATQAAEAQKLLRVLTAIDAEKIPAKVQLGSMVKTNVGRYYFAASLGKVSLAGEDYFVISPGSPLGQAFFGKAKGDTVSFMGQSHLIEELS